MVAVLQPTSSPRRSANNSARPAFSSAPLSSGPLFAEPGTRPQPSHLRLVAAQRSGQRHAELIDPRLLAAAAVGLLLMLVVVLRVIQGGPPATTWEGLEAQANQASVSATSSSASSAVVNSAVVSSAADIVIVAEAGDSWWAIAERFAPGADTTEVVRVLTAHNGGSALAVGQQVIIPASLQG